MQPFHRRLAIIGLQAGRPYGLALAGGYAVQAAGIIDRPSADIDLFVHSLRLAELDEVGRVVADAYVADGLAVEFMSTDRSAVVRLWVTDSNTGDASKVEMCGSYHRLEPVLMDIGPVLHPDDAVAQKMCALFGRLVARDFIDVDAAIQSGRYTRDQLIDLANDHDRGLTHETFAAAVAKVELLDDDDFAAYGLSQQQVDDIRWRFAEWHRELTRG